MRPAPLLLATALTLVALAPAGCGGGEGASTGSSAAAVPKSAPERPARSRPGGEPGGEASIEGFGAEAEGAPRAAILSAFHGYLGALAAGNHMAVCAHLAAVVRRSLARLAGGSKPPPCPRLLSALLSPEAPATAREQRGGRVRNVRIAGERGIVVFHAPGAKLYQMPMAREAGEWKVGLLAASVLVPDPATFGR